jgi:RNA polymerase sigma-70 factor, ECF subfamily
MQPTDEELVAAYLERQDEQAFELLVRRHQDRIYGYLLGMVRDRATASDLFQDTFLRVIAAMRKERASYERQGRWLAWVMRIARNAALDHARRRKKWQDVDSHEEDGYSFWDRLEDEEVMSLDMRVHEKDRRLWLEQCIDRLPDEQREVLLLRHETDLTFREIADMTGVSINTALGRMRYGLLNLKKMMDAGADYEYADLNTA